MTTACPITSSQNACWPVSLNLQMCRFGLNSRISITHTICCCLRCRGEALWTRHCGVGSTVCKPAIHSILTPEILRWKFHSFYLLDQSSLPHRPVQTQWLLQTTASIHYLPRQGAQFSVVRFLLCQTGFRCETGFWEIHRKLISLLPQRPESSTSYQAHMSS